MTTTKPSLKATKQAIAKPSKVEIVLNDKQLLGFAPIVSLASEAFQYGKDCEEAMVKASLSMGEKYAHMAQSFCFYMQDTNATWQDAQLYKQHLAGAVSSVTGAVDTNIIKALNKYIKEFLASDAKLEKPTITHLGWEGSKKPSALSNKKARTELASIVDSMSDTELTTQIANLAKAGDKDSLKRASQLATEKDKRKRAVIAEQKKLVKTSVDSLIKDIKANVMTPQQVACLSFAINNLQLIESVMRDKGVNKITDI
jgi:hypothetical protein